MRLERPYLTLTQKFLGDSNTEMRLSRVATCHRLGWHWDSRGGFYTEDGAFWGLGELDPGLVRDLGLPGRLRSLPSSRGGR